MQLTRRRLHRGLDLTVLGLMAELVVDNSKEGFLVLEMSPLVSLLCWGSQRHEWFADALEASVPSVCTSIARRGDTSHEHTSAKG